MLLPTARWPEAHRLDCAAWSALQFIGGYWPISIPLFTEWSLLILGVIPFWGWRRLFGI
jgi:hypothetical protein